jgi:hypothetical protein
VVFVAVALGVVAAWQVLRHRSRIWAATGAAALAAVVAVRSLEAAALHAIVGAHRPGPSSSASGGGGFLADRVAALRQTWLAVDATARPASTVLLLAATVAMVLAVWQVRKADRDDRLIRLAMVGAAALVVLRVLLVPASAVPGLLIAFPLLWIGLCASGPATWSSVESRVLAAVAGLAALGVLATQYRAGGSAEWGGRYFAVLLPLLVPLAVAGLASVRDRLDAPTVRVAGGALLVISVAFAALAAGTLRHAHDVAARRVATIEAASSSLDQPVVVTDERGMPRFAWPTFAHQRWLLVDPARDRSVATDLAAAGVHRFVLVSGDVGGLARKLGGLVPGPGAPGSDVVAVVELPR